MKLSELSGALLDYWVARALGKNAGIFRDACYTGPSLQYMQVHENDGSAAGYVPCFSPSTDWAHGGPIIDRERINVVFLDDASVWTAGYGLEMAGFGSTRLVAAMRAFVASKFGDEVPDEVAA